MNQSPETRSLRYYMRILRQRRRLVIACTALAALAALAYSLTRQSEYQAVATVSFSDPAQDVQIAGTAVQPDFQPEKTAAAQSKLVTRDDVLAAVKRSTGSSESADALRDDVSTAVEPDSNLVDITASATTADTAAQLANAFANQTKAIATKDARSRYLAAADRLREQLDTTTDPASRAAYQQAISRMVTLSSFAEPMRITKPADVPGSPSSPKPIRDTLIGAILGLLLGVGLAFVRHTFDRRVIEPQELQRELALPLVGSVRSDTLGWGAMSTNGNSGHVSEAELETFRILRANVDFLGKENPLKAVAVSSPLPQEGKSTVAAWLAYASATAGRRTILVESDFRRPVLADRFDLEPSPGLTDYLAEDAEPAEVLRSLEVEGRSATKLAILPAGKNAFQPAEMIGSRRFQSFLAEIRDVYDLVVLDCPPVLPVGDTLELIPQVDGVLLCVRLEQTTHEQVLATMESLGHLPKRPIGLVITGVKSGGEGDYYGYYSSAQSRQGTGALG